MAGAIRSQLGSDTHYLGLQMASWLDHDLQQRLRSVFAHTCDALAATTVLFSKVARQVGSGLGYPYPEPLERNINAVAFDLRNRRQTPAR